MLTTSKPLIYLRFLKSYNYTSASFYLSAKRRHPPALLRLLSKSNPLCWASIWGRRFAAFLFYFEKISVLTVLCRKKDIREDVLLFLTIFQMQDCTGHLKKKSIIKRISNKLYRSTRRAGAPVQFFCRSKTFCGRRPEMYQAADGSGRDGRSSGISASRGALRYRVMPSAMPWARRC